MNWANQPVSIVILSSCRDEKYYRMNLRCLDSLISSEPTTSFQIILVETSRNWASQRFPYTSYGNVQVIQFTEALFHYNRCLNLGLNSASNPIVAFCNNDVIFHPGWFTEMMKVRNKFPWIQSLSPFDRTSPYLSHADFKKPFYPGYRVPVEFTGWCFVCERIVFELTGMFDETFDLYFQDNDFTRTLKFKGIIHAMVPASFVEHAGGTTTGVVDASQTIKYRQGKDAYLNKWSKLNKPALGIRFLVTIKLLLLRLAAIFC